MILLCVFLCSCLNYISNILVKIHSFQQVKQNTIIRVEVEGDAGGDVSLCAFIAPNWDGGVGNGKWDTKLPGLGFKGAAEFTANCGGCNFVSYCKTLP